MKIPCHIAAQTAVAAVLKSAGHRIKPVRVLHMLPCDCNRRWVYEYHVNGSVYCATFALALAHCLLYEAS